VALFVPITALVAKGLGNDQVRGDKEFSTFGKFLPEP